ncbi:MAG: carbohydrate kinase family protein [Betaproteobacteria bacterium]
MVTPHRAIGIGELLWDLLPAGPRLGGAPFNVIAHLARFGVRTAYVSAVGRDERGRQALDELGRLGVETAAVELNDLPTGTARVRLDPAGVPEFEIVSPAAYEAITPPTGRGPVVGGGSPELLVYGTLALRFKGPRAILRRLVHEAPTAERLYDVNLRPGCWEPALVEDLLSSATVVKLNDDEQRVLALELGLPSSSSEAFGRAMCRRYELRGVCVTRGPRGAVLLLDETYAEVPAPVVHVVDTVGAGDAFAAGLGFGLLEGWNVQPILTAAARLGSFVASRAGAIPPWTLADIGLAGPTSTSAPAG